MSFRIGSKEFKMVFKVEKTSKVNYLLGTAHFFPYSFKSSLRKIISKVKRVLFEGPLNESDMETIRTYGQTGKQDNPLIGMITKEARAILNEEEDSEVYRYIGYFRKKNALELETENLTPWFAFFKIWSLYLRKRGWIYSVDMEAHNVAKEQRKEIHYLETIEEQIRALENIPLERIVNFLNQCSMWEEFAKRYADFYLKGDLDSLLASTISFPTRCPSILDERDPVLFLRILPFFEDGDASAFLGVTHVKGILDMFKKEGYSVSQGL